ncbi:four-carbon acid sugar kinase family protein [Clostridium sp. JNZ J1-5]
MINYVVIADDLTGANATGALLKKLSLKPVTLTDFAMKASLNNSKYDTILYSTDSRGMSKEEAYKEVFEAAEKLKSEDVKAYSKRIDTTLRGNLGAEIDAILEGLGEERIAAIVPVFPDVNRIAVGGYLLIDGVPLQETDAARDSKRPINTSVIEELVKKQTKYEAATINLDIVKSGIDEIKNKILELHNNCKRLIIFDAISNNDLEVIAKALIETKLKFVSVDPGPFTAAVAKEFNNKQEKSLDDMSKEKKVLMAIGSITNTTKVQLEKIVTDFNVFKVDIIVKRLIESDDERECEINRVTEAVLEGKDKANILCVAVNSVNPENRIDLDVIASIRNTTKENLSLRINESIAEISNRIIRNIPDIGGIFSSGGDISVEVCKKFNSAGLELIGEVIPLAAYGSLIGGEFPELKIVSKGGIVGNEEGMKICVQYLLDRINSQN